MYSNQKYKVIIFEHNYAGSREEISTYSIPDNFENNLTNIIEGYKNDRNQETSCYYKTPIQLSDDEFDKIFRELICCLNSQSFKDSEGEQEFSAIITELNQKNSKLKLENKQLKNDNKQLTQKKSRLNKNKLLQEKQDFQNEISLLKDKLKNNEIKRNELDSDKKDLQVNINTISQQLREANKKLNYLDSRLNTESQKYQKLNEQYENLKKSKETLRKEKEAIEEKLRDAQEKLGLATTRLHQQTINPVISGGGSRSDQLKNEFENLKRGLFHNVSGKVFNYWKQQDPELKSFRSEEFFKIKSILSDRVFINGMSYFADKSEVDKITQSFISELFVEGISLDPSVSQTIEKKIKRLLLDAKGVSNSNEALTEHIDTTTKLIQDDLKKIKYFLLPNNVLQEIKSFVEEGLKLVQEIVNDTSSGEFYVPEAEDNFDENIHEPENEFEGKVKFTVCPGYRILETVLVKANVFTYIPSTSDISEPVTSTLNHKNENRESTQDNSSVNRNQKPKEFNESFQRRDENINKSSQNVQSNNIGRSDEKQKNTSVFKGRVVLSTQGVKLYKQPQKGDEFKTKFKVEFDEIIEFDNSIDGDEMSYGLNVRSSQWYREVTTKFWIPAIYVKKISSDSSPISTNEEGQSDETK